jgi:hypothetical protein
MPQTQISCPQCRQIIPAIVEQLFDVTADPESKRRLLGGVSNRARCQFCGYEGNLATPVIYHDADKELLLTYFPAELGMPVNEQEKLVGPLINQVLNRLPAEKRKAYLFRPQSFLTYQSMIERILEADGVTKEMLDGQQKRVQLIQRLLQAPSPEVRLEMINQDLSLIDEAFFALMSRLFESALASKQEPLAKAINELQQQLMDETDYGKQLKSQVVEVEAAVKSLQDVGQGLTREKLLEIFIEAPNEARVKALAGLTRNGLDYSFFQILTERIDMAKGAEKEKLEALRTNLLEMVNQIDKQMEEQLKQAQGFVNELLTQADIAKAAQENLDMFNEPVVQVLNNMLKDAQQKNDVEKLNKLQQVVEVLQAASTPPELSLIEQLLDYEEKDLEKKLQEHDSEITPQFMELLGNLVAQMSQQQEQLGPEEKASMTKIVSLYNAALKYTMKKNMK